MEPRGVTAEIRERITSGVERARDAVRAVTAAVRERLPGASEREVAQASGDYFVDATERDVAEAGGDAALSPAVREHVVEADILPAELAGIAEQRQGVPLEDNAIAQLETGHADLVTAGIETMAAEDPETAAEVAVLVDEASALPAPADAGRSHEGGAEHGELARLSEIFERQYRQELAGGFDELVTTGLSDAERQFIASSEEVRAKIEAARASFAGEPIPAVEYVGSPEVMRQSAALFEIARRVTMTA